ncbi:MAG: acetolactate synthase 2 catalytic subunit [Acidobacteriota bacterium]|nr:acetolactate synthase 2 catalytic subunit [Acidobacteriota bacterium]
MNGATFLVKALEREGVDVVFGYPGGAIMPFYDALLEAEFRHILVRHEQAAALAADGYARVSGKVGVCIATSGPGATNLVTGLANAMLDSVPVVALTGQVPSVVMGTDAFQEVDVLGITLPIVKHSFLVKDIHDLPAVVHEAFRIAVTGRPGPVLIDLPKDIQNAEMPPNLVPRPDHMPVPAPPADSLQQAAALLAEARRPLVYAGGGVGMAGAVEPFREFLAVTGLPVVTTLKGLGNARPDNDLFLGMLGMHGAKAANYAVQECDLLVVVGARFDDRATGKLAEFAPKAKVIHMDIDAAELGKLRETQVPLRGGLIPSLRALSIPLDIDDWRLHCKAMAVEHAYDYAAPGKGIYAPRLLHRLSQAAGDKTIISCDVGQHQMWVAQHYRFHQPNHHLTSGGLGTMGYGLPAAMGACYAAPDHRVIAVSGDGSFMMNIQELATLKRYNIPVKILLLDNSCLGMVRQWQDLFFAGRKSQVDLSDNPDFTRVAEAFGIPSMQVRRAEEESDTVDALLQTEGPLLVHALIDPTENVWPLVPPGANNAQMMEGART